MPAFLTIIYGGDRVYLCFPENITFNQFQHRCFFTLTARIIIVTKPSHVILSRPAQGSTMMLINVLLKIHPIHYKQDDERPAPPSPATALPTEAINGNPGERQGAGKRFDTF
jgi:hypothetical protein